MAAPDALLSTLDPDQHAAATHPCGPLQIIAGAGTGKTRVLVARIAWLVGTGRARPEEICAPAFMNDAARQIERRLRAAIGVPAARRVWAGTSHRLAAHILGGHATRFGRHGGFSIWDEHDVDLALTEVLGGSPGRGRRARVRAHARDNAERLSPPHGGTGEADPAIVEAIAGYEHAKRVSSAFDFDDLLRYAVIALESDAGLRAAVARRWRHVLVDEFQDLNPAQYRLAALIAEGQGNLTVLGDPRQAICAYRGATSAENLDAFAADFPQAQTVTLARNHRSRPPILAAANRLAAPLGDPGADLWTASGGELTWQPTLEDYLQVVAAVLAVDPDRAATVVDRALAESALAAPLRASVTTSSTRRSR